MAKETVPNGRYTDEFKLEALRLAESLYERMPILGDSRLTIINTLGLLSLCAIFIAVYRVVATLVAYASQKSMTVDTASRVFVLTLVPIAIAYLVAHYSSYFLIQGQFNIVLRPFHTAQHHSIIVFIGQASGHDAWCGFLRVVAARALFTQLSVSQPYAATNNHSRDLGGVDRACAHRDNLAIARSGRCKHLPSQSQNCGRWHRKSGRFSSVARSRTGFTRCAHSIGPASPCSGNPRGTSAISGAIHCESRRSVRLRRHCRCTASSRPHDAGSKL